MIPPFLGRIPLLLERLQTHILIDLLQAFFHLLQALEFGQLLLRLGGTPRRALDQGETVMSRGGERFQLGRALQILFGLGRPVHLS